jgi:hypothetical protein
MNTKKLNLDLALQLVNQNAERISLSDFKSFMQDIQEAGAFKSSSLLKAKRIGDEWLNRTFSLQYENCTVNVDFIENAQSKSQILKSFKIT